jgi:cofilin
MATGRIWCRDDIMRAWNDMKIGHKNRYLIIDYSDYYEQFVVAKAAPREATYEDFLHDLPPRDARFAVYDYEWKADDGTLRNKLVFIVWAPDISRMGRRMLMASRKSSVKSALQGVAAELHAADDSEIEESLMLQTCKDTSR